MRHRQAALGHQLHQVSQAQLESKIPTHAQDNDLAVEVAALEQRLHAPQLAHCRPSASSAASIADWRPLFAPEPSGRRPRSLRKTISSRFPPRLELIPGSGSVQVLLAQELRHQVRYPLIIQVRE